MPTLYGPTVVRSVAMLLWLCRVAKVSLSARDVASIVQVTKPPFPMTTVPLEL